MEWEDDCYNETFGEDLAPKYISEKDLLKAREEHKAEYIRLSNEKEKYENELKRLIREKTN